MRRMLAGLLLVAICSPVFGDGDGDVNGDQLKRMYDNAVAQLRAAQDRRNELAKENESLTAQIRDLKKQAQDAKDEAQSKVEGTFKMRREYGAFQEFLERYPGLDMRWRMFLSSDTRSGSKCILDQLNSDWPFSELK